MQSFSSRVSSCTAQEIYESLMEMTEERKLDLVFSKNYSFFTIIHEFAFYGKSESITAILKTINQESRIKLLFKTNKSGISSLHFAVQKGSDCVMAIMESIPEPSRMKLATMQDLVGDSPISDAIMKKKIDSLNAILSLLSKYNRDKIIKEFSISPETITLSRTDDDDEDYYCDEDALLSHSSASADTVIIGDREEEDSL